MIEQRDSAWWFKLNGAARLAIYAGAYRPFFDTIAVVEYPKSGGTWLSQMLSSATGLPYPRNRLPTVGGMILHGHYLGRAGTDRAVIIWRDGRDVAVSEYYHWAFPKGITRRPISDRFRRALDISDPHDIARHFPRFLEWSFAGGFMGFDWARFEARWHGRDAVATRYEALLACPEDELRRVLVALGFGDDHTAVRQTVAALSFEAQSGRKPGQADPTSFLRKAVAGDWQNVFSSEARQMFDHHAGDALIRLGYEPDRDWVAGPFRPVPVQAPPDRAPRR